MVKISALQTKIEQCEPLFSKIEQKMSVIGRNEVDVICFPEKWTQYNRKDPHAIDQNIAEDFLSRIAREYGIYVIGGAILEESDNREYVTCPVFDGSGNCIGRQRKLHLYALERKLYSRG